MKFYQDHVPTPFVTVGNTGSCQPQLQQPTKNHILQDQYITGLENRIRVLWDKYYGDLNYYMERIKRLEEAGDKMFWTLDAEETGSVGKEMWRKAKEDKLSVNPIQSLGANLMKAGIGFTTEDKP